jgi:hypothetical protein
MLDKSFRKEFLNAIKEKKLTWSAFSFGVY